MQWVQLNVLGCLFAKMKREHVRGFFFSCWNGAVFRMACLPWVHLRIKLAQTPAGLRNLANRLRGCLPSLQSSMSLFQQIPPALNSPKWWRHFPIWILFLRTGSHSLKCRTARMSCLLRQLAFKGQTLFSCERRRAGGRNRGWPFFLAWLIPLGVGRRKNFCAFWLLNKNVHLTKGKDRLPYSGQSTPAAALVLVNLCRCSPIFPRSFALGSGDSTQVSEIIVHGTCARAHTHHQVHHLAHSRRVQWMCSR